MSVASYAKNRVRAGVKRALVFVTARPALSFFVRRQIARSPALVQVLRRFVLRLQNSGVPVAPEMGPATDLSDASEATRQIFDDLRRARRNAPHS